MGTVRGCRPFSTENEHTGSFSGRSEPLFVPPFCVTTACMVYCFRVISMPRIARKKSISNIYHVMIRGINRQNIFEEDEDRLC